MAKSNETGMDRLKKIKLWQWGLIVIFAGLMTSVVNSLQGPLGNSAEERAQALGRGFAVLLFVVIGLGLIIAHFVRQLRK